jgi:hypothetical protein
MGNDTPRPRDATGGESDGAPDPETGGDPDPESRSRSDSESRSRSDSESRSRSDSESRSRSDSDREDLLAELFRSGGVNAVIAWSLVGALGVVLGGSLLEFDRLWILFVAAIGVIVLLPPVAYRDWRTMLPWEVLVFALSPVLVRGLFGGEIGTFAYYLSVAGLALVVTVELHMFTRMRMTHWFAVVFVVMTTLASAAAWAIVRWSADRLLGTEFLSAPGPTGGDANAALMTEFVWVTLAGIAAGLLFDTYFKRRGRRLGRSIQRVIQR